jgi:hypothetical protein
MEFDRIGKKNVYAMKPEACELLILEATGRIHMASDETDIRQKKINKGFAWNLKEGIEATIDSYHQLRRKVINGYNSNYHQMIS